MPTTTEQPQPPIPEDRPLARIEAALADINAALGGMNENMITKADIERLRAEMAQERVATARMRAETPKIGSRILRWQIAMWIVTMVMLLGLFGLILSNRVGG